MAELMRHHCGRMWQLVDGTVHVPRHRCKVVHGMVLDMNKVSLRQWRYSAMWCYTLLTLERWDTDLRGPQSKLQDNRLDGLHVSLLVCE